MRACGGLKGFGFRRQAAAEGADGQNRGGGSVEEMISDYNLLLTNVAVFFLNKGFRHIRYYHSLLVSVLMSTALWMAVMLQH